MEHSNLIDIDLSKATEKSLKTLFCQEIKALSDTYDVSMHKYECPITNKTK